MKVRGQNSQAWLGRWRQGTCPIHGRGLVESEQEPLSAAGDDVDDDDDLEDAEIVEPIEVKCTKDECTVVAMQWPGKDRWHSVWGWQAGPSEIHQALFKAGDIPQEGPRPGFQARMIRTAWPLGEGE